MAEIKITYKKSTIGCTKKVIATIKALGLRKLNSSVIKQDTPQIRGMIAKVAHLVETEEM